MVHLVLVHGRSQEFGIPVAVQRPLEEGLRWGLERVGAPWFADIPVSLAFYGDHWRPDSGALEAVLPPREPTALQRQIGADLLAASGASGAPDARPEGLGWGTLNGFATFLDTHLRLGDLIVRHFLEDVESYFGDVHLRSLAIDRVADEVTAAGGDVVLLGHSLGSVVAYDTLQARPDLPVRGFITLGSPLGLPTVLRRLAVRAFPPGVPRWANVFDPDDFVTGRVALRAHYPAADTRAVEDLETEGRSPGLTDPTAAHDGAVYLSSIALAQALHAMIDAASAPELRTTPEGVASPARSSGQPPSRSPRRTRFDTERRGEFEMLETAGGAAATSGTNRVDYFNRLLKAHGGRLEAAGDGPPDLSDGAINERIVETGAELHRIVRDELGDRPELHGIVDQIVARGDNALRQFRESDEERLGENPALVRDLEVIVKTDGSRPSFMIRNGAVDGSTSPIGDWQATLDAEAGPLQEAIAAVGRIEILGPQPVHQGTGFLVQKNLIVTNRHVLQLIATPQANGAWTLKPGAVIDFGREHRGIDSHNSRALKRVVFAGSREIDFYQIDHAKLDLALIEIEPVDGPSAPTPLVIEEARDWAERDVPTFIIGYPGEPPFGAYVPDLLNQLFRSTFGFKRLAPGNVIDSNYQVEPWTVAHDCTTLGGNSGSVVLVVGRDTVAAGLHYGGGRGSDDDSSENWGHVLGKVLDQPGDASDKTLRKHLEDFNVEMIDSLA